MELKQQDSISEIFMLYRHSQFWIILRVEKSRAISIGVLECSNEFSVGRFRELSFIIGFQEFKNKLLGPSLVDHIVVSNKSVAKVFEKLEEAQEALGIEPHDYVPVTYVSEMVWYQELMRFTSSLLLLGSLFYTGPRIQGGLGVGGGGGKGVHGIFSVGKAHVTKVVLKDVASCDQAKQEIMEFVHLFKDPKKYEDWEGKLQMLHCWRQGNGAPCVVSIDEIDATGQARG
ncbi:hypothetical protein FEM48_Zijuj02G0080500 [Ziziphus jujuba var. spinosa]|uniref:Uncharacterized protein n=1 Tax=Ziziphus jujuba var. spinosa TaxID=714518 RepID=A0A978VUK4_ZIZJJ|nr:hypothetical protein FEM48_Zijuj02G0080500 [Ziziphus jujuba var. spinosa]